MQIRSKDLFSSACGYTVFLAPFFEETLCSPVYIFGDFVRNEVV